VGERVNRVGEWVNPNEVGSRVLVGFLVGAGVVTTLVGALEGQEAYTCVSQSSPSVEAHTVIVLTTMTAFACLYTRGPIRPNETS
jgi:NADPH:quinone reductase-like Zn-dependent oxidoreductase